jgi:hypothetical protein
MKKLFLAVMTVMLFSFGIGSGPAWGQGPDWHSVITPPVMKHIMEVMTLNGTASDAQCMTRQTMFAYWLAAHREELDRDPAQTIEAGLADPAVAMAGQGEMAIPAGSPGMPPCVATYTAAVSNCSKVWPGGPDCVRSALINYLQCIRGGCNFSQDSGQLVASDSQCRLTTDPPCKSEHTKNTQVVASGPQYIFWVYASNWPKGPYTPGYDGPIKVTVSMGGGPPWAAGSILWEVMLEAGQFQSRGFSIPAANQMVPLGISITVNVDPFGYHTPDYSWYYSMYCF